MSLIKGSLNLITKKPIWLRSDAAFISKGIHHFFHARISGYPVVIDRWSFRCPVHTFEIYAEEHLRCKFSLRDGDRVDIEIDDAFIDQENTSNWYKRILWYAVWRGRETWLYPDGLYRRLVFAHRAYRFVRHTFHDPALRQERDGRYIR